MDIDGMVENKIAFVLPEKNVGAFWVKHFWTGLNDLQEEGKFVRSDGSAPKFLNWLDGEPNDVNGGEDCTEVRLHQGGVWNDLSCYQRRAFVCEKSQGEFSCRFVNVKPEYISSSCLEAPTSLSLLSLNCLQCNWSVPQVMISLTLPRLRFFENGRTEGGSK